MKDKQFNILIADDHELVREGLKLVLRSELPNAHIGDASNGNEAWKMVMEKEWDLVIMDVNMPGRDGLDILEQFKSGKVSVPVLVLSMHPEGHMAVRALKSGARGYLTKSAAGDELMVAVRSILAGKKYISTTVANCLADQMDRDYAKAPHELLSNREFQTVMLMSSGKSVGEIASFLSLSVATVSTYRARILAKLGVKNNADLVSYAVRNSLV